MTEKDQTREGQPLDSPIIFTEDDESRIKYTGWANSYNDDDEQQQFYLSITAEDASSKKRFALFFNPDFRPYFNEAVSKYLKEKKGDSAEI